MHSVILREGTIIIKFYFNVSLPQRITDGPDLGTGKIFFNRFTISVYEAGLIGMGSSSGIGMANVSIGLPTVDSGKYGSNARVIPVIAHMKLTGRLTKPNNLRQSADTLRAP